VATIRCQDQTFTPIEAVIFDKDGTLADVASFLKSLGQKRSRLVDAQIPGVQEPLLMAFGFEENQLSPSGSLAVGSRRENEIIAAAYVAETGRDWLEALEVAQSAFAEADSYLKPKAKHTPLFAGALETLVALTTAGITVGILSADLPEQIAEFIQHYDLTPYIQAYLGVTGTISKPDPTLFHQLCADLKVAPEQTLIVGDACTDIKMGQAAGAAGCIQVTWGWSSPPNLGSIKPDATISQWDQLQILI
jgi:phosphoglycolate phosphatase